MGEMAWDISIITQVSTMMGQKPCAWESTIATRSTSTASTRMTWLRLAARSANAPIAGVTKMRSSSGALKIREIWDSEIECAASQIGKNGWWKPLHENSAKY